MQVKGDEYDSSRFKRNRPYKPKVVFFTKSMIFYTFYLRK